MTVEGVHVALVTPFHQSGLLDHEGFIRHLETLAKQGVKGFVPCATTGENASLVAAERKKLIQATVMVARAHQLKVTAGCGSNSTQRVVELIKEAADLGCDAALVVTPYYNRPTLAGVEAHYHFIAEHSSLPVLMYNVPGRTNINLTPDLVVRLLKHPKIIGIKEASGSYAQWITLATKMDLQTQALLAGDDDCVAAVMALGGSGVISASANLIPAEFVAINTCARAGKWMEAFAIQKRILPLLRALFLETNPAPLKYALQKIGAMENEVRLPLVRVTETTRMAIDDAMRGIERKRT